MAKLFDADGNEVEAFTKEEVEVVKQNVVKDNPEIKTLQGELEKTRQELAGLKDKDFNFATLKEAAEKRAAELESKINGFQETAVTSLKNEVFKELVGDDADLRTKLEEEYKSFRGEPTTKEEILAQAQKALAIVKPPVVPGAFDAFNAAPGSRHDTSKNGGKAAYTPTPEISSIGKKMGVSEEDWKKYGGNI